MGYVGAAVLDTKWPMPLERHSVVQQRADSPILSNKWSNRWNGRFTSWMCSRRICSICVILSCQYGPNSEECFQYLVESMPQRIKAVLKAKGGPTRYLQGIPNKMAGESMSDIMNILATNCFHSTHSTQSSAN
ncbi:hypothetical protein XENOCAPTIV_017390 [Xenoophorus captivus]|uniref:Uncharacterized protein n=1 Tax=Xenoophorus captivus TaxID=1517983 RepID=A0ABV0RR58_9TELE